MLKLEILANQKFDFGTEKKSIQDFLKSKELASVASCFPMFSDEKIALLLREVLRYLFVSIHSPGSLFFPGNNDMDQMWHALIIETSLYRKICNNIKPNSFVDHWGVAYQSYIDSKSTDNLHEEQLSWLATYVKNFGPIAADSYESLVLAQSLSERLGLQLPDLNKFAQDVLLNSVTLKYKNSFNLVNFLNTVVSPAAQELDASPFAMRQVIVDFLEGYRSLTTEPLVILKNSELEEMFSVSTAFGFTIGQHFSAIERLSESLVWQESNSSLWASLKRSEKFCGLATTHIVKPGSPVLKGTLVDEMYILNGVAPWCCGYQIYENVVVGFHTEDEIVFAVIDFPKTLKQNGIEVVPYELSCLNGTASVRLQFENYAINKSNLVSKRKFDSKIKMRPSRYVGYELGIGKAALNLIELEFSTSTHPKMISVKEAWQKLIFAKDEISQAINIDSSNPKIPVRVADFNRNAVRLLSIALGAKAIMKTSPVARWQQELLLFDAVIQSPTGIVMKVESLKNAEYSV